MRLTGGGPFCTMHELGECRRECEINASVPGKALRISAGGGYDHLFTAVQRLLLYKVAVDGSAKWKDENFVNAVLGPRPHQMGQVAMFCSWHRSSAKKPERWCSPAELVLFDASNVTIRSDFRCGRTNS